MPLNSLDFLSADAEWPPPSEAKRLDQYNANRKLFEADHASVFKEWWRTLREDYDTATFMVLNWPKRLSTLWADLLVGEPPRFKAGEPKTDESGEKTDESDEQKRLDALLKANHFDTLLHEGGIDISRFGDALFKVRLEDGRAVIEGQSPSYWFPVTSLGNVRDILYHVVAWQFETTEETRTALGTSRQEAVKYLKVEVHERGAVEHRLLRLGENGRIEREAAPTEMGRYFPKLASEELDATRTGSRVRQDTGVDDFLVVHAPGMRTADRLHGVDDYSELESIVQEMEVRLAQISRILDKHADPNVYGDPNMLARDPRTGETTLEAGGKFFPIDENGTAPGYMTWDGSLAAAYQELEELKQQFYLVSETSAAAFGRLDAGIAESGTALRRLMQAPLAKVGRIRTRLDPVVKDLIELAAALEDAAGNEDAELKDIQITWNDGLPDDEREQADIEQVRLSSGTTSKLSSIQRLDGVDEFMAKRELQRIAEEGGPKRNPLDDALDGILSNP